MFRQYLAYNKAYTQVLKAGYAPSLSANTAVYPTNITATFYDPSGGLIDSTTGTYYSDGDYILVSRTFPAADFIKQAGYICDFEYSFTGGTNIGNQKQTQRFLFDVGHTALFPVISSDTIWNTLPEIQRTAFTNTKAKVDKVIEQAWEELLDDVWLLTQGRTTNLINNASLSNPLKNLCFDYIYMALGSLELAKEYRDRYKAWLDAIAKSASFDSNEDGVEDTGPGVYSVSRLRV